MLGNPIALFESAVYMFPDKWGALSDDPMQMVLGTIVVACYCCWPLIAERLID